MIRWLVWPLVACVSGLVLRVLTLAQVGAPERLPLAVWFLLICTGMSIVPVLRIRESRIELLVGALASLAIDTLVATALAGAGVLTTTSALTVLEAVCVLGAAMNIVAVRTRGVQWSR